MIESRLTEVCGYLVLLPVRADMLRLFRTVQGEQHEEDRDNYL